MSIKEMNRVWDISTARKTALLAMLALADMADDNGISWPGQDTIAHRARTTRRTILSIVQERTTAGELAYIARPGKSHAYCMLVGLTEDEKKKRLEVFGQAYVGDVITCANIAQVLKMKGVLETSHPPVLETSHPAVQKDAQTCTRSVIETSVETSDSGEAEKPPAPPKKERKRDLLFDAVVTVSKLDAKTAGSFIGKEVSVLRKANRTSEQVLRFGEIWYTREFPGGLKDKKPPSPATIAKYIGWVDEDKSQEPEEKFNEVRHPFDLEAA